MNKVAIFTINGNPNFGNKLQNYALQKVLKDLNFESETIINNTNIARNSKSSKQLFFEGNLSEKLRMIKTKFLVELHKKDNQKRKIAFDMFTKNYIREMKFSIEPGKIPEKLHSNYKYFIAGSDQVWNPNIPAVSELSFLTFVPKEKRITYAPSFGVSVIPKQYETDYRKWLMGIDKLSIREEEGAKIIENLTGKKAKVVIDPTMLLTKNEWLNISKKSKEKPKGKYVLTYFLGDKSKEVQETISNIAKNNNFKIVNLATVKDKKYYFIDPSEFIDYINDASIFFTDSFHGCVFSLLLETPFVVCDRMGHTKEENMSSRIDTFVKKFKLESRKYKKITEKNLFICDYTESNKILELERIKSYNYLKDILGIEEVI